MDDFKDDEIKAMTQLSTGIAEAIKQAIDKTRQDKTRQDKTRQRRTPSTSPVMWPCGVLRR